MPTAAAPMAEKIICHVSEGIMALVIPRVAWKPASIAGTTKISAMTNRAQSGRTSMISA